VTYQLEPQLKLSDTASALKQKTISKHASDISKKSHIFTSEALRKYGLDCQGMITQKTITDTKDAKDPSVTMKVSHSQIVLPMYLCHFPFGKTTGCDFISSNISKNSEVFNT